MTKAELLTLISTILDDEDAVKNVRVCGTLSSEDNIILNIYIQHPDITTN